MPGGLNGNGPDGAPKRSLWQRFQTAVVKPVDTDAAPPDPVPPAERTEEVVQAEAMSADDKERAIGLLAAPVSSLIAIWITQVPKGSTHASEYHELLLVLLALSTAMLLAALFRKRLFLGAAMALYGLSTFNLHFWGFGIPYILFGSWLLVRAYRLQRELREVTGDLPARGSGQRGDTAAPQAPTPKPSKRYTPPTSRPQRPAPVKPEKAAPSGPEQRAG